jgi:hypothetical protein
MAVSERDREVCRRIGEVESEPRPAPVSFSHAVGVLERLLERDRAMFPGRKFVPDEDELGAHLALYARARTLGWYRD